jgi:hypothetical protein
VGDENKAPVVAAIIAGVFVFLALISLASIFWDRKKRGS